MPIAFAVRRQPYDLHVRKAAIALGILVAVLGAATGIGYDSSPRFRGAFRYATWRGGGAFQCNENYQEVILHRGRFSNPKGRAVEIEGCRFTCVDCVMEGEVGLLAGSAVHLVGGRVKGTEAALLGGGGISLDGTEIEGPIYATSVTDVDAAARGERLQKRREAHAAATCSRADLLGCFNEAKLSGELSGRITFTFDSSGNAVRAEHEFTLEPSAVQRCIDARRPSLRIPDLREGAGSAICEIGGVFLPGGDGTASVRNLGWQTPVPH